jgi:thiol-disulfide isomerase/thioredoxin
MRTSSDRISAGRGRPRLAWAAAWFLLTCAWADQGTQFQLMNLPMPPLAGETQDWLNTEGKAVEIEKSRIYVIEFWTFGCVNCQRNLPIYARWQKRFAGDKVTLIGIHTPETAAEKKRENVVRQVKKLGITYPVLLDQKAFNWERWQQRIWPTVFLVDKHGRVRCRWTGELEWQRAGGEEFMARQIRRLLDEP